MDPLGANALRRTLIGALPPSTPEEFGQASDDVDAHTTLPLAAQAIKHKSTQQAKARSPRSPGLALVISLSKNPEYRNETARELWPRFINELRRNRCDPEERHTGGQGPNAFQVNYVVYPDEPRERAAQMTFSSFKGIVSQTRNEKFNSRAINTT
jgi:hypothetical protein